MAIFFEEDKKLFHLTALNTSYVFQILDAGEVVHRYWGRKYTGNICELMLKDFESRAFSPEHREGVSLDLLLQEYPSSQYGDFREPAYEIVATDGSMMSLLKYKSHRIVQGKAKLEELPATYSDDENDVQTLYLILVDEVIGLEIELQYSVFERKNAITRSVRFINRGDDDIDLQRAFSMSIDFDHSDFKLLHLAGAWARERSIIVEDLEPGIKSIQSRRGASSHQHNPFMALINKNTTEDNGDVFGFSFVYSGNFLAQAEVDQFDKTRVQMGVNPSSFSWLLESGEEFQTPEVVMVYSCSGLGGMSRTYHDLYRENLCRGWYKDKVRPVLANSWEAMYFDFTSDDIVAFAKSAGELGIELVVMDDGWFGKRDQKLLARDVPSSSLGDWYVNSNKIPEGIAELAKKVQQQGVGFGIWFEPEMVSPDSDLFRLHPDWCIQVEGRSMCLSRGQHILDLTRKDVCDYIVKIVSDVLGSGLVSYVKWDMNRNMSNIGSKALPKKRQREVPHRYILGLYSVLERLITAFPNVLFEGCAGGGGRFDPGMLQYMPQLWTSDNTDAISRIGIQIGTSVVYPSIVMGCHVSDVPNHQTGRVTSLKFRGDVAMMGNLGYELDLQKISGEKRKEIKEQIRFYKDIRETVQFGDMYWLGDTDYGKVIGVQYISKDKKNVLVFIYEPFENPNLSTKMVKLKGLNSKATYLLLASNVMTSAQQLMDVGLEVKIPAIDSSMFLQLEMIY